MAWRKRKLSLLNNLFVSKICADIYLHYSPAYCTVNTRCLRLSILVWITWVLLMRLSWLCPMSYLGLQNGAALKLLMVIQSTGPNQICSEPALHPKCFHLHRSALVHLHLLLMKTEITTTTPSQPFVNLFVLKAEICLSTEEQPWGVARSHMALTSLPVQRWSSSQKHLFSFGSPMDITGQPSLS